MTLHVIGAKPEEFFTELHGLRGPSRWSEKAPIRVEEVPDWRELERFKALLEALVGTLAEAGVIDSSDLRAAVEAVAGEEGAPQ